MDFGESHGQHDAVRVVGCAASDPRVSPPSVVYRPGLIRIALARSSVNGVADYIPFLGLPPPSWRSYQRCRQRFGFLVYQETHVDLPSSFPFPSSDSILHHTTNQHQSHFASTSTAHIRHCIDFNQRICSSSLISIFDIFRRSALCTLPARSPIAQPGSLASNHDFSQPRHFDKPTHIINLRYAWQSQVFSVDTY